jgi:hypothetical protein
MIAVIKGRGIVRFAVLALLLLPLAHTATAQAAPPPNTGWAQYGAVDAKTGKDPWKFRLGSGVGAAPMTYAIDGKQYIAVVAGRSVSMPNWLGKFCAQASDQTPESGRLFVFAVD